MLFSWRKSWPQRKVHTNLHLHGVLVSRLTTKASHKKEKPPLFLIPDRSIDARGRVASLPPPKTRSEIKISNLQHGKRKRLTYSHFSLVRTISGKEKILYYRELLVSEKFFKTRWIPLVLPSPVILGESFFLTIENYWLVRNVCTTLGFPCGFTVSAESPVYFGRKV